ncbi:hypothetical protein AALK14_16840 [Butyricimonas hominis]|uniref:hypothetical protein n=1 Tax=Butyricimonas TaxID=574697 RepID=UPI003510F5CC
MRKLLFLFTMLALFVACSDDDDKDNELPIKGLEIPKFENPVRPGESITIKGEGFTKASEIWFRTIIARAENTGDVKAIVTEVNSTGITFIAPEVYGDQSVLLKENGEEYELGKMTFEEQPEEGGDVEILPKKVKKIVEFFEDDKVQNGIGKNIYEFSYNNEGKLSSLNVTEDGATEPWKCTYTYSSNQLVIKEIGSDNQTETYTIENGKATHYKKTYLNCPEYDEFTFDYSGDYLSQIKGIIENEYPSTENFTFIGGKLIQYKWIDEEFDNVYALLDFTYGQQLNNLNLDLFGIILTDYFENVEDLFLYGITGKRSIYLPEKVKVSGIDDEDGKYEYPVSFKYEVKDNYITKIIIDEDGEKYEYEIFYEN